MTRLTRAHRAAALFAGLALAAPLTQAGATATTPLDLNNLPCTPSCSKDLLSEETRPPVQPIVTEADVFDWKDASIGALIGIGATLVACTGTLGARRLVRP